MFSPDLEFVLHPHSSHSLYQVSATTAGPFLNEGSAAGRERASPNTQHTYGARNEGQITTSPQNPAPSAECDIWNFVSLGEVWL